MFFLVVDEGQMNEFEYCIILYKASQKEELNRTDLVIYHIWQYTTLNHKIIIINNIIAPVDWSQTAYYCPNVTTVPLKEHINSLSSTETVLVSV